MTPSRGREPRRIDRARLSHTGRSLHPHEQLPSKLCAYEPCYLRCGRSTPEKTGLLR